jgi:hypothetical protein
LKAIRRPVKRTTNPNFTSKSTSILLNVLEPPAFLISISWDIVSKRLERFTKRRKEVKLDKNQELTAKHSFQRLDFEKVPKILRLQEHILFLLHINLFELNNIVDV